MLLLCIGSLVGTYISVTDLREKYEREMKNLNIKLEEQSKMRELCEKYKQNIPYHRSVVEKCHTEYIEAKKCL